MSWFLWYIITGVALMMGVLLFDWSELKVDLKSDPIITIGALVTLITGWPAVVIASIYFTSKVNGSGVDLCYSSTYLSAWRFCALCSLSTRSNLVTCTMTTGLSLGWRVSELSHAGHFSLSSTYEVRQ